MGADIKAENTKKIRKAILAQVKRFVVPLRATGACTRFVIKVHFTLSITLSLSLITTVNRSAIESRGTFLVKHRDRIDSKFSGLIGQSGFGNMFSGLISIGGMCAGLFGNLSASLKPASKRSKKSKRSLHAPVKRKTSSTESHKATKRKKYETSSHSRKRSDERRHRNPNGKRDKRSRSRSRHEKYRRDRRDDRNNYTATKQNITAAAASAHGSRTAFAFFQTNSKKVVVKKDQSSSDTVREPKNPFQFFMEYKNEICKDRSRCCRSTC